MDSAIPKAYLGYELWVLGCCIAGSVEENEFAGAGNHVFDPSGEPVRTADDRSYELALDNPPQSIVDPAEHFVSIETVEIVTEKE